MENQTTVDDVEVPPEVREYMRRIGSKKTASKAESSRRNGELGGREPLPLADIPCACGAGDALTGHRWDCPRGQAIKRRQKTGKL